MVSGKERRHLLLVLFSLSATRKERRGRLHLFAVRRQPSRQAASTRALPSSLRKRGEPPRVSRTSRYEAYGS